MRTRTTRLAIIACALLAAGCASYERMLKPRISCTGEKCDAKVTVSANGDQCKPDAINPIDLKTGTRGPKFVKWTIETPGYEFSNEPYKFAIFIKNDPLDEFKNAHVTEGGKVLTIQFNAQHPDKAYLYAITVRKTENKAFCETLDPWLLN